MVDFSLSGINQGTTSSNCIFFHNLEHCGKKAEGEVEVCLCVNLWHRRSFFKKAGFCKFALLEIILGAERKCEQNMSYFLYLQTVNCLYKPIHCPKGGQKVRTAESFYSDMIYLRVQFKKKSLVLLF